MSWGVIGGAAVSLIGGALLSDDNGAEGANNAASSASDASAAATKQQAAIAQDQWDTYKKTYEPMEKEYVADSRNSDTPEAYARAAGEASATTATQYGKARDQLTRTPGLDPSSAAYTSAMAGLDMGQAASDAVGQNAARGRVSDMAWAKRTDALSLGKGLAANASAGLSSVASANAQTAQFQANQAQAGQAQANQQGAQIGNLFSQGINAWNKSSTPPATSPGLSTTQQQGYTDFTNNYTPENYG